MRTPKQIFNRLAEIAPSVAFKVVWTHDQDAKFSDIKQCLGPNARPSQWQAWASEVNAVTIINGELFEASEYLCGTWEKARQHPGKCNPDISGYLPQMLEEALQDLASLILVRSKSKTDGLEVENAIAFIKTEMRERYDEQQKAKP